MCALPSSPLAAATEQFGQQLVLGDENWRAALWGHAWVGEVVERIIVVAEDCDGEFEQFGGVAFVAEHGGDGVGRHGGVGHKCIREELDRGAGGDSPQDLAFAAINGGSVVDKLTVLKLPLRVWGDEGVLVEGFSWSFDSAYGSF